MRRFFLRLWSFFRHARMERDLSREIASHLELLEEDLQRRGRSEADARRAARLALAGIEQAKDAHRDARSFASLEDARRDVVHAVRLLRRNPLFTVTAAVSLAIGIGANTAVFTVANALLFRDPSGVVEPDRVVQIGSRRGDGGLNPLPFETYLEIRRRATTVAGVFAHRMFPRPVSLVVSGTSERVFAQAVTHNYFAGLGASPSRGRLFDAEDERFAVMCAVLSHDFFARRFGGDAGVIGATIRLNGQPFTVIGVASEGFQGTGIARPDVWVPIPDDARAEGSVVAGARLRAGISASQAAGELDAIGQTLDLAQGRRNGVRRVHVLPASRAGGNRNLVAGIATGLMAIVSLVLAVACSNIAGILLAQAAARRREMAVRIAIGAGRRRLIRQILTETAVLFLLGGSLGLLLARVLVSLTSSSLPSLPVPLSVSLPLDMRVVAFTIGLSLVGALLSGIAPAFKAAQVDPLRSLKEASQGGKNTKWRGALVVTQVAISLLLVVMAGLFVRVLRHAGSADPGFDPNGVELATLDLSTGGNALGREPQYWRELLDSIRRRPGVESATLARVPPGGWEGIGLGDIQRPGTAPAASEQILPSWNIVTPGYFATLRIPVVSGRDFDARDAAGLQPIAIVGERLAHRLWPNDAAVGKYVSQMPLREQGVTGASTRRELLVVGVVRDIKSSSLVDGLAESYVYLPLQQAPRMMTTEMTIVARAHGHERIGHQIRAAVSEMDPDLVFVRAETLDDAVALGLAPQRLLAVFAGSLGLVGLLLASLGVYGVTAYSVAQRTRDIGVRMTLGAERRDVVGMVVRQGMRLAGLGSAIGLVLAAGVSHALNVYLFGLEPIHLPTFAAAAILFGCVSLLACGLPARRAAKISPLVAVRYE